MTIGWHGIAMAKTYQEICPGDNFLVVDYAASVGGVWAKERLYPGLKTNNTIGSYEFSDLPMTPEKYGCTSTQHIPGAVVHQYLCDAVDFFGLADRLQFRTRVDAVSLTEDHEWRVEVSREGDVSNVSEPQNAVIRAKWMVVATGTTSEPYVPTFAGQEQFRGVIIHSKQLRDRDSDLTSASNVVVLGGNKSAWDVCYRSAKFSKVHLVIRPGGGGPCYCWPAQFKWFGYLTSLPRLANTRFLTWFNPCIWDDAGGGAWARYVLHRTWLGRQVNRLFWSLLRRRVQKLNGYDQNENLRKMKPWTSPYWMGNSLSTHNYETSWFEMARQGKVQIHIAEVSSLEADQVRLSNGEVLKADALVCCTGWKAAPPIKFTPEDLPAKLGLPSTATIIDDTIKRAEGTVYSRFPDFQGGPKRSYVMKPSVDLATSRSLQQKPIYRLPYRLFRFMVPSEPEFVKQRNIAFIGSHLAVLAIVMAQAQALWITAFFLDKIPTLSQSQLDIEAYKKIQDSAILDAVFEKIRHPPEAGGSGERFPEMVFDGISYVDRLLHDLGLKTRRKQTWWKELFEPYGKGEYAGLVQEWKHTVQLKSA